MACRKDHSDQTIQKIMADLPEDQGGKGRHKCAACAYQKGLEAGRELKEIINLYRKGREFSFGEDVSCSFSFS